MLLLNHHSNKNSVQSGQRFLKIEKIGIHDNFFKLGGHSLLATQVISRIRHTYNIDIPLRALFEHPTIAALSKIVESLSNRKEPFSSSSSCSSSKERSSSSLLCSTTSLVLRSAPSRYGSLQYSSRLKIKRTFKY